MNARNGLNVLAQEFVLIVTIKDPKQNNIYSEDAIITHATSDTTLDSSNSDSQSSEIENLSLDTAERVFGQDVTEFKFKYFLTDRYISDYKGYYDVTFLSDDLQQKFYEANFLAINLKDSQWYVSR